MLLRALLLLGALLFIEAVLAQGPDDDTTLALGYGIEKDPSKHYLYYPGFFELAVSGSIFRNESLAPVSAAILPGPDDESIDTRTSNQLGAALGVNIGSDQNNRCKFLFDLNGGILKAVGVWQPWVVDGGRWLSLNSEDEGNMIRLDWSQSARTGLAPLRILNKVSTSDDIMAISHPLVSSIDSAGNFEYKYDSGRWVVCTERNVDFRQTSCKEYFIAYLVKPGRIPRHCASVTLTPVAPPTLRTISSTAD